MAETVMRSETLAIPCAEVMRLLADGTRLKIVERLLGGAQHVQGLNAHLRIDPTLLSHHLRVLREARLVEGKRAGRYVTYRLSPRVRSAIDGRELDFGCCKLRFDDRADGTARPASARRGRQVDDTA